MRYYLISSVFSTRRWRAEEFHGHLRIPGYNSWLRLVNHALPTMIAVLSAVTTPRGTRVMNGRCSPSNQVRIGGKIRSPFGSGVPLSDAVVKGFGSRSPRAQMSSVNARPTGPMRSSIIVVKDVIPVSEVGTIRPLISNVVMAIKASVPYVIVAKVRTVRPNGVSGYFCSRYPTMIRPFCCFAVENTAYTLYYITILRGCFI